MRASLLCLRRHEAGALLLTVVLLLAVMAALALGMSRAGSMDVQAVNADYERRNAAYLAAGGLAAAKWYNQARCGNDDPPDMRLADAVLSMTVNKGKAHQISISSTAVTGTGATSTAAVDQVDIYNFNNPEKKALGGSFQDTYIFAGQGGAMNGGPNLILTDQSNALLSWATTDIPKDSKVLSATLTLIQNGGGSGTQRRVNLHRVTTQWDISATWTRPRLLQSWSGGDYDTQISASTILPASGPATWDVTSLVDAWYNNTQTNYGMLLRLDAAGQYASFNSREAPGGPQQQPALNVSFGKRCP